MQHDKQKAANLFGAALAEQEDTFGGATTCGFRAA